MPSAKMNQKRADNGKTYKGILCIAFACHGFGISISLLKNE